MRLQKLYHGILLFFHDMIHHHIHVCIVQYIIMPLEIFWHVYPTIGIGSIIHDMCRCNQNDVLASPQNGLTYIMQLAVATIGIFNHILFLLSAGYLLLHVIWNTVYSYHKLHLLACLA